MTLMYTDDTDDIGYTDDTNIDTYLHFYFYLYLYLYMCFYVGLSVLPSLYLRVYGHSYMFPLLYLRFYVCYSMLPSLYLRFKVLQFLAALSSSRSLVLGPSVGWSVRRSVMFVKKGPLEY